MCPLPFPYSMRMHPHRVTYAIHPSLGPMCTTKPLEVLPADQLAAVHPIRTTPLPDTQHRNISGSGQTTVYGLGNVKVSGSESLYGGGTGAISVSGSGFNVSMNSNGGINVSVSSYANGLGGYSVTGNSNGVHANTTRSNFSVTGVVSKTLGW